MTDEKIVEVVAGEWDTQLWVDPAPVVRASGFVPVTEMRLAVTCRDGAGREWISNNGFLVSAEAKVDTGSTAAFGEDYYGIAAEGPIYSLRCVDGTGHDFVLPSDGKLSFHYQLFDGGLAVWETNLVRHTQCQPRAKCSSMVFLLQNSGRTESFGAELLRSLGYEVVLGHIQPDKPDLDPILDEIRKTLHPQKSVHLVASSRASEAALELAQRADGLSSVTIFSGSGLRFSPWKIEGRTLEYTLCDHSSLQPRGRTTLSTRSIYAEAVVDRANRDRGRIEVEQIACPVFMFTGSDDQIWPSAAFSELVSQRRNAKGLESQTLHKTFPSVGYDLGPELGLPGLPTTERSMAHASTGMRLSLGGKMGRQSRARRECWNSLIAILEGATPDQLRVIHSNTTHINP